jgi:hypothetical protein
MNGHDEADLLGVRANVLILDMHVEAEAQPL